MDVCSFRHAAQQGAIVSAAYSLTFQLGFATSQAGSSLKPSDRTLLILFPKVAESLATSTQVLLAQALRYDGSFAPLPFACTRVCESVSL